MWVSKQRFTELEEKVNKLDLENVRGEVKKAKKELEEATKGISRLVNAAIEEKTKVFSDRFHEIQSRFAKQDTKIDEFISLAQKTTQKALSRISDLIKEISALIGEKPKEGEGRIERSH